MLSILTIALSTVLTHADVSCIVNAENPKEPNTFDQILYSGELNSEHPVIIKADHSVVSGNAVAEELSKTILAPIFPGGETVKMSPEFEGATLVFGGINEDKSFTIGLGHFDLSKPENVLVADELAGGSLASPLFLIDEHRKLSVACSETKPAEAPAPAEPAK